MRVKKTWLFLFLKIFIAAAALFFLFSKIRIDDIRRAFANPQNPEWILVALVLLVPNLFLQWIRWHFLLREIQPDVRFLESVSSLFGGMIVGLITPGRIGELGRSLFLKRVDRIHALGMVFLDKLYAFFLILVSGMWGLVFMFLHTFGSARFIVWPLTAAAMLLTVAVVSVACHPQWIRGLLYHISLIFPIRDNLKRFIHFMDGFTPRSARQFLALTAGYYSIYLVQFCFLAWAFTKAPLLHVLSATSATLFAKSLLPVSLGDLGIREGAAVYFFLKFQVSKVAAFNSSILLFAMNVLIPSMLGLFFLPRIGWKDGNHRQD